MWWGFEANQSLWKLTASSILSVLSDHTLGPVAPYVFHSIAFGSEPIGDDVDGGPDQFTADLKAFKANVEPFGIPVTISEDWDRPGIMSGQNWTGLGPVGQEIAPVIDLVHVHSTLSITPEVLLARLNCIVCQLCLTIMRIYSLPSKSRLSGHTLKPIFLSCNRTYRGNPSSYLRYFSSIILHYAKFLTLFEY